MADNSNKKEHLEENEDKNKNEKENQSEKKENKKKMTDKKIIYIDIDDEITNVYERIKGLKVSKIYLVVPERACLFNSIINLKILKRKLEDINKSLFIITNDKVGINLALKADIPIFEKDEEETILQDDKQKTKLTIAPITAAKNIFDEEKPIRLEQKKVSLLDLIKRSGSSKEERIINSFKQKLKLKQKKLGIKRFHGFDFLKGNRGAIGGLIIASIILLFFVSYIALPGATIYLKPKSNVIEQNVNITLAESIKNVAELGTHPPNMLAANLIIPENPISKVYSYGSTGTIFRGENARGEITIINESLNSWTLVPTTRFQSPEGIIFRISSRVVVPPAKTPNPGNLKVSVIADEKDIFGAIVGERGNLGPTRFVLPALKSSTQKLIYAKSESSMIGGKTIVTKKITADDVKNAKESAKKDIINEIKPALEAYIKQINDSKKLNLALLTEQKIEWKRAIYFDEPIITVDEKNLIDKEKDSFEVKAEVKAKGVAYNRDEFVNMLKRELKTRQMPQKRLIKIDDGSITYRLFEYDANTSKYKVTATIKGIEEYELDPNRENGERLIKKIREHIVGWDIKKAENFIQNLEEIDRVDIKTWPMWSPNLPNLESNIKVVILK